MTMATTTTVFRPSSTRSLAGRFSASCSCSPSSISASTVSCSRTIIAARSPLSLSSSLSKWRAFSTSTSVPGPGDFSRAVRRQFSSSPVVWHGDIERPQPGTGLKITFRESNGNVIRTVEANEGDDILSIAHEYDIDLEGACEGSIACSTCHVILPEEFYDRIEEPTDEENDMLDLAFGLTDTSRLGCQVKMEKAIDGITVTLPSATRNMFVDGAKPTKH